MNGLTNAGFIELAHAVVGPNDVWGVWNIDPRVIGSLALLSALYVRGARRTRTIHSLHVLAFVSAVTTLALALLSPLDAASHALFTFHMTQHLALVLVGAPLLVLGHTGAATWVGLPSGLRRRLSSFRHRGPVERVWRLLTAALVVWILHTLAMWLWHFPDLYEEALSNDLVHGLEHVSFLGTALLFWSFVLNRRRAPATRIAVTFGTMLQSGALGAILALSVEPLYASHVLGATGWTLSAIEDQQVAGVLMWVPPGIVYLVTIVAIAYRWFGRMERRSPAYVTPGGERR